MASKQEYNQQYYVNNKPAVQEGMNSYYANNRDAILARRKGIVVNTPRPEKCEVCGSTGGGSGKGTHSLCMDHNHSTRQFRGWLCHTCNRTLGLYNDDPGVL